MRTFYAVLFFLLFSNMAFANLNVPVAENSRIYHAIDQLTAFGLIDSAILNQRPLSWSEIQRLTEEAEKNLERIKGAKFEPRAHILVGQLQKQLPPKKPVVTIKPFQNLSSEYLFVNSEFRLVPNDSGGGHKMEALVNPL